jgi:hypothetical protein
VKNLCCLILILFIAASMYSQQKIGKHTIEEWHYMIDTTWGPGISTTEKLQIFDNFWNTIDQHYAGFNNIEDRWLEMKDYEDTISLGVSKGRFAGIMGTLVVSLQDGHVYMCDNEIGASSLHPGIPLLFTTAITYPSYSWEMASHFGAALSPLPDSTLLVYAAVPNHPIGLEPGDIVLGYDGEPWKDLYKKLLEVQFPIPTFFVMSGAERACKYQLLQAAGMNWHLFDTVDVVKYNTGDTLHFPTQLLESPMPGIHVTEQLPVPGVPFPDESTGRQVSWGIISGTQIGYIYVWGWTLSPTPFLAAVNALMPDSVTSGLIIDMRMNEGGYASNWIPGLGKLFDEDVQNMRWARRNDPLNHLTLVDNGPFYLPASGSEMYDRPIAVLCGPWTISGGDVTVNYLREHPMVKTFGLPTNGSFGEVYVNQIPGIPPSWTTGYAPFVFYTPPDISNILNHTSVPVDEEVWLTQEGVVAGEDDVVKRAIEWINSFTSINEFEMTTPSQFALKQNYPNPFNPSTKIKYSIPSSSQVTIKVFDVLGNEIETLVNEEKPAGIYEVEFNSHSGEVRNLPSGVYFYQLKAGSFVETKKMVLMK